MTAVSDGLAIRWVEGTVVAVGALTVTYLAVLAVLHTLVQLTEARLLARLLRLLTPSLLSAGIVLATPSMATGRGTAPAGDGTATMTPTAAPADGEATMTPSQPSPPESPPTPEPAIAPATWTVAPGESFWRIAEAIVAPGSDTSSVAAYWRRLIDANRDRLVDPGCPDLLFAGQVLALPRP